ncbi:phosphoesterase-domain-containing protein [Pseudovirgaria hyperparasitica]|uniref:Phosphoesterase-domain-containing protein n=1 Tax=Pseudovirgaria hyperparasitica TaxID=470096 RepID=A0A6A6VYS6_9PEZI|nr:phosphoesterase-domain-containing protein [Pseudovirgaria hyperparasitica]KAF2755019.1 phosphoesterase-domain-containing protein [Pseudovirgaria hyperparasitica]
MYLDSALAGVAALLTTTTVATQYVAQTSAAKVSGKVFDRMAVIWLENTNYDKAAGDPSLQYLAKKGITLSSYYGVTHPSEPNYVAAIGGDYFGMNNDDHNNVPKNISSIVDLLEAKGISWASYQEDMPYTGYQDTEYDNPRTGANMYVRKHNPCVIYDSVATQPSRLNLIKNLTLFQNDLKANALPQWMFITPNMTSDGHDSSVTTAGTWTRNFVEPLLSNSNFMNKTLVLITFDENHDYTQPNKVLGILLGDVIPSSLVGTTDSTFYDHYSEISTVEANWGLDTLGRFDVGANVFKFVADVVGEKVRSWGSTSGSVALSNMYFNQSYAGPFNSKYKNGGWAVPNVDAEYAGRTVLQKIKDAWSSASGNKIYTTNLEIPDGQHPPKGFEPK